LRLTFHICDNFLVPGQLKRVSIGEMLITNARFLALDEISNGLDAKVAADIISSVRQFCKLTGASAVCALLQATPEIFALFDNVILLKEGEMVYNGPREDLPHYLADLGIEVPSEVDPADFYVEFLTHPRSVYWRYYFKHHKKVLQQVQPEINPEEKMENPENLAATEQNSRENSAQSHSIDVNWHEGNNENEKIVTKERFPLRKQGSSPRVAGVETEKLPLSTESLVASYESSALCGINSEELERARGQYKVLDMHSVSPFTRKQYYSQHSRSIGYHVSSNLHRQYRLFVRNKGFFIPRLFQAGIMGLVLGSLFYMLSTSSYYARMELILNIPIFLAFNNMAEIPFSGEAKQVIFKQSDASFFPTWTYVLAVSLVHLLLAIPETFIFGSIVYFMTGFASNGGRYIFFVFILICVNLCMSKLFRLAAYVTKSNDVAQQLAGPLTAICLLFGGVLITHNKIPDWLIWCYWLSPFSWVVRSLAQSEFNDPRYDSLTPNGIRQGDSYLAAWEVDSKFAYRFAAVGYLLGMFLLFATLSAIALRKLRFPASVGTQRYEEKEESLPDSARSDNNNNKTDGSKRADVGLLAEMAKRYASTAKGSSRFGFAGGSHRASAASALPFIPMDLVFSDITYSVQVQGKDKKKVERVLLDKVSGYAASGSLTALMGVSGAGKTTLMDCIAGRKTSGKLEGSILVNGYKETQQTFNRVTGYCEQTDIHLGTQTVREALQFSARLRLPSSVSDKQRTDFVEEVLRLLELKHLANRLVGDENLQGLSPGERKRLTIGVELVANPSILFLDEPTTGLDSRSASLVMKVIRRIAATGRTVICTIHQPSAELFSMFDRLLLLKSGGKTVYFGDIGEDGRDLINYFLNLPLDEQKFEKAVEPGTMNPASWILEIVASGSTGYSTKSIPEYSEIYNNSALAQQNSQHLNELAAAQAELGRLQLSSRYATAFLTQFSQVLARLYQNYWRNTEFTIRRWTFMTFLGILFGLVYLQISDGDQGGIISKVSVQFMTLAFTGVLNSATALPVAYRNRGVFYREQASTMYSPLAYSLSMGLVELPFIAVGSILFVTPYYFLVGFVASAGSFFRYLLAHYLVGLCFNFMGQFWISAAPNIIVANILQGVGFNFLILLSGLTIQAGLIPAGWKWVYYMTWLNKGLIATNISQYSSNTETAKIVDAANGSLVDQPKAQFVSDYLDVSLTTANYWRYIGWLILSLVALRILVALAISKINHLKR
jgi:ABC-type multidrug transport system ATPase subunit/ABC-type multidrug transport system permease subunit